MYDNKNRWYLEVSIMKTHKSFWKKKIEKDKISMNKEQHIHGQQKYNWWNVSVAFCSKPQWEFLEDLDNFGFWKCVG